MICLLALKKSRVKNHLITLVANDEPFNMKTQTSTCLSMKMGIEIPGEEARRIDRPFIPGPGPKEREDSELKQDHVEVFLHAGHQVVDSPDSEYESVCNLVLFGKEISLQMI